MNTLDIHGKPYVMVKDRVIKFHEDYPNGSIETELIELPDRYKCRCIVTPDVENPKRIFTGHAVEIVASSKINELSAAECAETSAIGRGMAALGIGVDHEYASGDEVANAVFQQNEEDASGRSYQNTPETAENGVICPKCGGGVTNNRDIDGGAKLSSKGEKLLKEGKPLEGPGLKMPLYKCANKSCKGVIWDEPTDKEPVVEEELPF